MSLAVRSPVTGVVVALDDVPDPVFSGRIVGPGVAVTPDRANSDDISALAPISGTIAKIHPHAYVITDDDGHSVLVHLGLDTVSLGGNGFTLLASEGEAVDAGQPVITWSPARVEADGLNPIVPVIALEGDESTMEQTLPGRRVTAGEALVTWV
ncbi:PTS glucose transporter subunit IIA [Actinomyces sp. ZJ308]|uniref:PTS sugar transporter subunit IIA n=1 Tax=Actinomyces sp. ZJ308 TaxID=2708342 RepID=UPI00141F06AD|nr:PTS glucose transporter subunit IIA [Actinomyces sp. ZJ308]